VRTISGTFNIGQAVNSVCCVLLVSKTTFFDHIFLYSPLGREAGGDPNALQLFEGPVRAIGAHSERAKSVTWSAVIFFLRNGIFQPNFLLSSLGAGMGRGGRGSEWASIVRETCGSNWGPFRTS
jgi:hypothetical protein